ncbi:putative inorganic phosphate cotransporter [Phymastichus coffea]|uniref:putative inorganic phosphate cotransporter n=1 Tax=Phymastichus coffea TaxID=108790 RepID=UPI00273C28E6|nr:putative inorganic phosphate cotransporter [Phymastichus coffea]
MAIPTEESGSSDTGNCKSSNSANSVNHTLLVFRSADESLARRYPWDSRTQGVILSSFFWSYTIAQCFYGSLSERFGGKHLLGVAIFVPALLTFITPYAVDWGGSTALIVTRVLMGIANAGMYPVSSTMVSHWTTPAERTKIGNAVYAGPLLGLFIGTIAPAQIIKYSGMGWPSVFYFFGAIGMIWFPFWLLFVYEDPQLHPYISDKEAKYLESSLEAEKVQSRLPSAPWKHILLCKEFWAFTFMLVGTNWGYFAMVSDLPIYMGNVVDFSLENNGFFSALPYLFMWLNTMVSTWINDKLLEHQCMSVTNVRKLLASVSVMGPGLFLVLASYAECDKTFVVVAFMFGITLMGCLYPSVMMNPLDLSPNYAGSLMAVGNGLAASVGIITPYIIGVLTPNSTLVEWRLVFWIVFMFAVLSNVVYLFWFNAEIKPWNDPNFERNQTSNAKSGNNVQVKVIS